MPLFICTTNNQVSSTQQVHWCNSHKVVVPTSMKRLQHPVFCAWKQSITPVSRSIVRCTTASNNQQSSSPRHDFTLVPKPELA